MNAPQEDLASSHIGICVGAVVLRENKVLFVRQAYGGLKGKWSLPWGFVDHRNPDGSLEPPDAAAVRETHEEAGVLAEVEGLLGVQNHSTNGETQLYIIFLCRHIAGHPTPDDHETDKAAYLSLDDIAGFDEPIDEFCEWMARSVLEGRHHVIPPRPENPYYPHLAFL
jgi:ADP-ribose pyrophosphatase YjhB (NUDIX family)